MDASAAGIQHHRIDKYQKSCPSVLHRTMLYGTTGLVFIFQASLYVTSNQDFACLLKEQGTGDDAQLIVYSSVPLFPRQ